MCASPPAVSHVSPKKVDVSLITNQPNAGVVSVSSLAFYYAESIVVTDVAPRTGSIDGGTVVVVSGGLFDSDSLSDAWCRFGSELVALHTVSDTIAECISPPATPNDGVLSVPFVLVSDREMFSKQPDSFSFVYESAPTILSLWPLEVPVAGNVQLLLEIGSVNSLAVPVCLFDGVIPVPAVMINSSAVVCVAPSHSPGIAKVALRLGGGGASNEVNLSYSVELVEWTNPFFQTVEDAAASSEVLVVDASPLFGATGVSTDIYFHVTGIKNVGWFSDAMCVFSFGNTTVEASARVVDEITVVCSSPSLPDPTVSSVSIYYNNPVTNSLVLIPMLHGGIMFTVVNSPSVTSVYPASGYSLGGMDITIGGQFPLSSDVSCKFGVDSSVSALSASEDEVKCLTPAQVVGSVEVFVLVNGVVSISSVSFEYIAAPVIYSVTPSVLSTSGGTVITVSGSAELESVMSCVFDTTVVPFSSFSSEHGSSLQCVAPVWGTEGKVRFGLSSTESLLGVIDSNVALAYSSSSSVVSGYYPRHGSTVEAVSVVFVGIGLSGIVSTCRIGDSTVVDAHYLNDTAIVCTVPAGDVGSTLIKLDSTDGVVVPFEYIVPPTVTSVSPSSSILSSVEFVTITGGDFSTALSYECSFNYAWVTVGYVISSNTLSCKIPFPNTFAGMSVDVKVSVLGVNAVGSLLFVSFADDAISENTLGDKKSSVLVTDVFPLMGDVAGGTLVTLSGAEFVPYANITCSFGTQLVRATVLSSSSVSCLSPALSSDVSTNGTVAVALTVDNVSGNTAFQFNYVSFPIVTAMSPATGYTRSGMGIHFMSSSGGFGSYPGAITCSFGVIKTLGVSVSENELICYQPQLSVGTVPIELMMYNTVLETDISLSIGIIATPSVSSLAPLIGTVSGGTMVTAKGSNFVGTCGCFFNDVEGVCRVVNAESLTCTSPVSSFAGAVDLRFTFNGASNLFPAHVFRYANDASIADAQPLVGSILGGSLITIYGYDFSMQTQAYCVFNLTHRVEAVVSTVNVMTCASPSVNDAEDVSFSVENVDGTLFTGVYSYKDVISVSNVLVYLSELTALVTVSYGDLTTDEYSLRKFYLPPT